MVVYKKSFKYRYAITVWALCLTTFLGGCFTLNRVMAKRLVMGRLALPGVRELTVGPVTGTQGSLLQPLLVQALTQLNFFTVADAGSAYMAFNQFGLGENYNKTDAVVTGAMDEPIYDESFDIDQSMAADGRLLTTYVRHPHIRLRVQLQVVDPTEQEFLGATTLIAEAMCPSDSVQIDGLPLTDIEYVSRLFSAPDLSSALKAASERLAILFANEVRVREVPTYLTLYHDASEAQSVTALDYVRQGKWNSAIEMYSQMVQRVELSEPVTGSGDFYRAQAHYNLGVALAYSGHVAKGIAELELAHALRNDKQTLDELERVRQFAAENMSNQGSERQVGPFLPIATSHPK